MEAKPAPNSEFGAGLEEQKIDREAALPNHIVYDLVCDTLCHKPEKNNAELSNRFREMAIVYR